MLFGAVLRAKKKLCFLVLSLSCSRSCFLVLSFVPRIVLFGALLCGMLSFVCFWVLSFVPRIVLFGALLRNSFVQIVIFGALPPARNRALDRRAFYCSPSYQEACFLVLSCAKNIGVDIWGGLLGPDFVAVNLLCPTPITTFSMPRPKKTLQKCNPSLDKSSLQNPKDLTRGLQETLQKSRRCL